jgi:hypothetical protein
MAKLGSRAQVVLMCAESAAGIPLRAGFCHAGRHEEFDLVTAASTNRPLPPAGRSSTTEECHRTINIRFWRRSAANPGQLMRELQKEFV